MRLSHISSYLPWSESVTHMTEWSQCMRLSGYSEKERYEAIRGSVMRQEEMKRKVEMGEIVSLHRDRKQIIASKERKGGFQASTWYLQGSTSRTVRVDPTPGGILCKEVNKILNPEGCSERTHVVEEGGIPVTTSVRRNDPFYSGTCRYGDQNCIVKQGVNCSQSGCLYEITCNNCLEPVDLSQDCKESREPGGQPRLNYIGMTMTSLHNRMVGHLKGQRYKNSSNPLFRHDRDKHNGAQQTYSTRLIAKEQKIMPLAVLESLYIESQIPGTTLNDRNERGRGGLVRIQATRD